MTWLWIILAFIAGGAFGVVMMCCFIVASQEDERLEKGSTGKSSSIIKVGLDFSVSIIRK